MGNKLKKHVIVPSPSQPKTEYAGNYVYENGNLQFFNHPEGYIEPENDGTFTYIYQYKDHLGNIRLSYADKDGDGTIDVLRNNTDADGDGDNAQEIREEKNYYPFGLTHRGYNNVITGRDHKYGFGGKEEQNDLGINWIDVTARNYDPALGRWMNIDPLAEDMRRHSPYNFGFNNPIFFQDYDGMAPQSPYWKNNGDGTFTAEAGDGAETLARDAGISKERAYEVLANTKNVSSSLGTMGTYEDKNDGVIKSAVDEGDIVTIPEQVNSLVQETKNQELLDLAQEQYLLDKTKANNDYIENEYAELKSVSRDIERSWKRAKAYEGMQEVEKYFRTVEPGGTGINAGYSMNRARNENDSVNGVRRREKIKKNIDSAKRSMIDLKVPELKLLKQ